MSTVDATLKVTPLDALHAELGARMVPFAGYHLPLQYNRGIKYEHLHTRSRAGLFDVSHMGQISLNGPVAALETLVPGDIAGLAPNQQRYTVLTNAAGGIIDDLMVTRLGNRLHLVVNAAFKYSDFDYLRDALGRDCELVLHADRALLALQGPAAAEVMDTLCPAAGALGFMQGCETTVAGLPCIVSRCGYTGEDGFEISVAAVQAIPLARRLLAHAAVEAAGLGARDSLRLEAGLCLSGTDIGPTVSPVQAGLGWVVARKYLGDRAAKAAFPGNAAILAELRDGSELVRVGLRGRARVPARAGAELRSADGIGVGSVTSGGFGPSVDAPIAMGYVVRRVSDPGTVLNVVIRERVHEFDVVTLPFVAHRYHRTEPEALPL